MLPTNHEGFLRDRGSAHMAFTTYITNQVNEGKTTFTIGTHHEKFHADELMACVTLANFFDVLGEHLNTTLNWEVHRIARNDQATLDAMDILVDVGREYDPSTGRFDHHHFQEGEEPRRIDRYNRPDVELSSFGMVWHACGLFVTGEALSENDMESPVHDHISWILVRGVDASDNGYVTSRSFAERKGNDSKKILFGPMMHISKLIGLANGTDIHDDKEQLRRFMRELEVRRYDFEKILEDAKSFATNQEKIRQEVEAQRGGNMPDILVLREYVRWTDHLPRMSGAQHVRVVITQVGSNKEQWNINVVNRRGRYAASLPPKSWRGLEGDDLRKASGIPDVDFCHAHGYLVRASSYAAALKVALVLLDGPD